MELINFTVFSEWGIHFIICKECLVSDYFSTR